MNIALYNMYAGYSVSKAHLQYVTLHVPYIHHLPVRVADRLSTQRWWSGYGSTLSVKRLSPPQAELLYAVK